MKKLLSIIVAAGVIIGLAGASDAQRGGGNKHYFGTEPPMIQKSYNDNFQIRQKQREREQVRTETQNREQERIETQNLEQERINSQERLRTETQNKK